MDSHSRISQTSFTPSIARQTPKNEFGDVLANTVISAVTTGGALASSLTSGSPVLSAAVSSLGAVVGTVSSGITSVSAGRPGVLPGVGGMPGGSSGLGSTDLLKSESYQYLELQNQMQKESREFTTVSNILKVRHDSAKAAINNIR